MAIKIKAKLDKSKFSWQSLHKKFKELPEGEYKVYICNDRPQRSLSQNAYYWGVLVKILAAHLGYTPIEMHEVLKFTFNPIIVADLNGVEHKLGGSTRDMNTKEFEDYMEEIRRFVTQEHNCYIPLPGEFTDEMSIMVLHDQL